MEAPPGASGALSARSGGALALVTALAWSLGVGAMAGGMDADDVVVSTAVSALILWPFAMGAHYAATRWVGVSPTPLLDALVSGRRGPLLGFAWGNVLAVPNLVLSLAVLVVLPLEVRDPSGVPFVDMSALEVHLANLVVLVEEFVFRLVLFFPLLALLGVRHASRAARPPWRVWLVIGVTSVLFALAHMGMADAIGADRGQYLVFALVQKGLVAGTILGYVAWRWGVGASMMSHYTLNLLIVAVSGLLSSLA